MIEVLEVTRGHITIRNGARSARLLGEMVFLENHKIQFYLYADSIKNWAPPHENEVITRDEAVEIVAGITANFVSGGHQLEVEGAVG